MDTADPGDRYDGRHGWLSAGWRRCFRAGECLPHQAGTRLRSSKLRSRLLRAAASGRGNRFTDDGGRADDFKKSKRAPGLRESLSGSAQPILSKDAAQARIKAAYLRFSGNLASNEAIYSGKLAANEGRQKLAAGVVGGITNVLGGASNLGGTGLKYGSWGRGAARRLRSLRRWRRIALGCICDLPCGRPPGRQSPTQQSRSRVC